MTAPNAARARHSRTRTESRIPAAAWASPPPATPAPARSRRGGRSVVLVTGEPRGGRSGAARSSAKQCGGRR